MEKRGGGIEEGNGEGPKLPDYLWIESFREAVEIIIKSLGIFFPSGLKGSKEGEFKNSLHALMTLLFIQDLIRGMNLTKHWKTPKEFQTHPPTHASPWAKFHLLRGHHLCRNAWRDLFHAAIPKFQQIAKAILEKQDAKLRIERLIQYPRWPQNSRRAVHWIKRIDQMLWKLIFQISHHLEESYRVTSRLGIVDPFWLLPRRNSMGDIKSFFGNGFPRTREDEDRWPPWEEEKRVGTLLPCSPQCEGVSLKPSAQVIFTLTHR